MSLWMRLGEVLLRIGLGLAVITAFAGVLAAIWVTRGGVLLIPLAYMFGGLIRGDWADDDDYDLRPTYPTNEADE